MPYCSQLTQWFVGYKGCGIFPVVHYLFTLCNGAAGGGGREGHGKVVLICGEGSVFGEG